jgi:hypothetical protein
MFLQVRAALFHFNQHDGLPNQIGETCAAIGFAHAPFKRGTGFLESTCMTKRLKNVIEKDLSFALFVARNVLGAPCGEFSEFFSIRHNGVLQEEKQSGNSPFGHHV